MIKLRLIRKTPKDISQMFTHGELFIWSKSLNKWLDFCYTLEDKVRDINKNGKFDGEEKKVYGQTAIPFGKYKGQVTMSHRFERLMPLIYDVDGFTGIRIHGGNTAEDSLGCILIAHNTDWNGKIYGSAESDLTNMLLQDNKKGEFEIEII